MFEYAVTPVASCSFFIALATIPLILRVISRRIGRTRLWWDDWFAFASWPFSILLSSTFLSAAYHGFGQHGGNPTFFLYVLYFGEIEYNPGIAFVKFSVLCFYYRIFEHEPAFTRQLRITAFFVLIWLIAFTFASIFQCIPIQAYWDPTIKATCVNKFGFFMGQAIPNIVLDVVLLVLPLRPLWKLHMRRQQRILLLIVFVLGYLNPVISILRIVSFIQLGEKTGEDINYNFTAPALWSCAEAAIAIFSCSIPSLTHLYRRVTAIYRDSYTSASSKMQTWTRSNRVTPAKKTRKLWGTDTFDILNSKDENHDTTLSGRGTHHQTTVEPNCLDSQSRDDGDYPMDKIHVRHDVEIIGHSVSV